jgi:hypothetical protein
MLAKSMDKTVCKDKKRMGGKGKTYQFVRILPAPNLFRYTDSQDAIEKIRQNGARCERDGAWMWWALAPWACNRQDRGGINQPRAAGT